MMYVPSVNNKELSNLVLETFYNESFELLRPSSIWSKAKQTNIDEFLAKNFKKYNEEPSNLDSKSLKLFTMNHLNFSQGPFSVWSNARQTNKCNKWVP